jgi:hypothetical protein
MKTLTTRTVNLVVPLVPSLEINLGLFPLTLLFAVPRYKYSEVLNVHICFFCMQLCVLFFQTLFGLYILNVDSLFDVLLWIKFNFITLFQKEVLVNLMIIMNHKILLKKRQTMMRTSILIQQIFFRQALLKAVGLISKDLKLVQMMRMIIQWMELILP